MSKIIKFTIAFFITLIVIISAILYTAPRFAQSYIEDNSKELLGRQIRVEKISINYFSQKLSIENFSLFEANDKDVFVSFDEFMVDVALIPSLKQEYTISALLLDNFQINIATDGQSFNFDDLIPASDTTQTIIEEDTTSTPDIKFSLNNVVFSGGSIIYHNPADSVNHEINDINFELPELSWNNEQSQAGLKFNFEPQGELELNASINHSQERFFITTIIRSLALDQFSPEIKAFLATTGIEGILNNEIHINGSTANPNDMIISGEIELSQFTLNDAKGTPVVSNGLLGVYIDSIDLLNNYYGLDKIHISEPKIFAQLFDEETNFDQLLLPTPEDTTVSNTPISEEVDSGSPLYFRINSFVLDQGEVHLTDHSPNRPFIYHLTAMNSSITNIASDANNVPVSFSMVLNDHGSVNGQAKISLLNSNNIEYSADLDGLNLKSFSPYSEYYIARPIQRGHLNFDGNATMTANAFNAENKIQINDLEMGDKTADEAKVSVPINFALAILQDKNGDIDIDLPLTGNPSDPDFNLGKIIISTLTDFIVKIASSPFTVVGDIAGVNPERIREIDLVPGEAEIDEDTQKTLEQIAIVLEEKPTMKFIFTQEMPLAIEQETLALEQVKRNYISTITQNEGEIEKKAHKLKTNDADFITYVQEKDGVEDSLTIAQQCVSIIGESNLNTSIKELSVERDRLLSDYLLKTLKVDPESVVVRQADTKNRELQSTKPRYNVEISVK